MPLAFVIGGARRLGRSISLRLASAGYDIGVTYHTSEQHAQSLETEITQIGLQYKASCCDLRDEQSLRSSWDTMVSELGVPDLVVVAAGVFPDAQDPINLTSEQFINAMRVNALPLLVLAGWYASLCASSQQAGRIVSIGSLGATEIWKDRLLYNSSKAAARTAALSLARSLAPRISVNIVAPGAIAQPNDTTDADKGLIPTERIPMQRHGTDVDVCDAVMFFATSSNYITGQTIYVDGGYGLTR
ncbi:MAG: SDR family NAD(P)-dependent oxidoreductase [Ignavibacteria bacterium]|jgi:NAD(P)-dependent dehydrogenase (short-subunit alcohol dehydrogenase family)